MFKIKTCTKCEVEKPLNEFHNNSTTKDGKVTWCKDCQRDYSRNYYHSNKSSRNKSLRRWRKANPNAARRRHLKREYGLSLEDYDLMLTEQQGLCAICGLEESYGANLVVDHNHDTGQVRALLCHRCNRSLGGFNDDPDLVEKALVYLQSHVRETEILTTI